MEHTPRHLLRAENYPKHIALPRGCLDAVQALLRENNIRCDLRDERIEGQSIDASFLGSLRPDQETAVAVMLRHDIGVMRAHRIRQRCHFARFS